MTIENSELNKSGALPSSNANKTGASGDGNDPSLADLTQGFSKQAAPEKIPHWLPQNADDGENYVGDTFGERGGFAGRPRGSER
jgi:hypothetical protein